jgi:hypothetical protein
MINVFLEFYGKINARCVPCVVMGG